MNQCVSVASSPTAEEILNVECLCQVLAHLLDMVFYSDEKERVIPLLVNIMHYVVPYLRNHRSAPSYGFTFCVWWCLETFIQCASSLNETKWKLLR